jgi:hypothetical protein
MRLMPIVDRQQNLLTTQGGAARSIDVISDFQKSITDNKPLKVDSGIQLNLVQLKANAPANIAVDSVWLLSATHRPGETEKIVVKLHNYADEKLVKIPLKLFINGEQKALGGFTLQARAAQTDTLTFSGLRPGWQHGEITLQDNPVTFDNQFYFTFNVKQQMPVLLIDGGTVNPYLNAVFSTDQFFSVKRVPEGNVDYARLGAYPLIVISDVKSVSAGLAQQLKGYVNNGGTLMVFPAVDADLTSYKSFLQPLQAAFPERLTTEDIKVSSINIHNQIFKNIFEELPSNPDLPVIKKYYQLSASSGRNENVMQMQGGQAFWAGYNSGKGKVYVAAVALDEDFSNLPRHALFVPIMFRIALLSGHDQPLFYMLGHDQTVETMPIQSSEKQLLKLVKGKQSIIPDVRQQEGATLLYVSDQLQETGLYELKKQDSIVSVMAFNDNRNESDLQYYTVSDLNKIIPENGNVIEATKGSVKDIVSQADFGVQLWKLCIILALIFLAIEILLTRFYKPERQLTSQPEQVNLNTSIKQR